jgi:NTE family protein
MKKLALVLGGGGARGALQVGALRAIAEAGLKPSLIAGASIGALNGAYWALHGLDHAAVDALEQVWRASASADILPSNYLWLSVRALFNRPDSHIPHRMRDFLITHGITPELTFAHIPDVQLLLVTADLNHGELVLYGLDPAESVLEGVLASAAIPPWVQPLEKNGRYLLDGGFISNLPIEAALQHGAEQIIALDLTDPREVPQDMRGFGAFLSKTMLTVEARQSQLERALADARGVPVLYLRLLGDTYTPLWDFKAAPPLIEQGEIQMRRALADWLPAQRPWWQKLISK